MVYVCSTYVFINGVHTSLFCACYTKSFIVYSIIFPHKVLNGGTYIIITIRPQVPCMVTDVKTFCPCHNCNNCYIITYIAFMHCSVCMHSYVLYVSICLYITVLYVVASVRKNGFG